MDLPIDSTELNLSEHVYPDRYAYPDQYQNEIEKQLSEALDDQNYGFARYNNRDPYPQYENDLTPAESRMAFRIHKKCALDTKSCGENESCIQVDPKINIGLCQCNVGFIHNLLKKCVPNESDPNETSLNYNDPSDLSDKLMMIKQLAGNREDPIEDDKAESTEIDNDSKIGHLSVSAVSKTVQLPDNKAKLAAFPVPDERTSGVTYNYSWSLISQPSGDVNGTMSDKTKSEIELTNLSEGLYRFKVVVTGKGWLGETFANITVLPEKRYNKPPVVIIKPAQQIIKEPTNSAILDGSASTDDAQIKSWRWDLIQGPINYQPALSETSTLQLTNLTLPGNYTFKLTVTDSDNATNSTTANITVLKATDYPPSANAGKNS